MFVISLFLVIQSSINLQRKHKNVIPGQKTHFKFTKKSSSHQKHTHMAYANQNKSILFALFVLIEKFISINHKSSVYMDQQLSIKTVKKTKQFKARTIFYSFFYVLRQLLTTHITRSILAWMHVNLLFDNNNNKEEGKIENFKIERSKQIIF